MKTTFNTIASTALSAAIVASSAIASASANELDAAAVWNPAPEPEDPPFQCTAQPETMIKSVPGGEMMCLTRGEGICRDNEGVLGVWGFGLDKDTGAISVVDPDGAVMPMYGNANWAGAEKLCIQNIPKKALYKPWHKKNRNLRGEEQEQKQERELASEDEEMTEPYMAIYGGGKRMAELICHGVGNQGVATQLKMTDLRGYNLAKEGFPFTVTKVKRGQLDDNEDNALWGVQIEHTYEVLSLQKVKPVLKAKIVYDDNYCTWVDNTQTDAPTSAPTTTPISSAPTPVPRPHDGICSKFKQCAECKDDKCEDCKTKDGVTTCTPILVNKLYCDYHADEPVAEVEDEKNSKNKNSKDTAPGISDAAYYSPFNLFGKCATCIESSTDLMAAKSCKGQDGECCDDATYGESTCGELVHGGAKVCRPKCSITSEVCYSNDDCCDKMCHINTSKGPGKEGIGFCMPDH